MVAVVSAASATDWADWRGPARDGRSSETNLPRQWSPAGENLLWKAPYGGRSTPVVLGDRVFLQNGAGEGETLQERVLCLDADTGELLWEYRVNIYHSDVPPHRVGWASPAADPATGNVYAFTVGGVLLGLTGEGELLWERSLPEDLGLITTHGGRTVSPILEGDLVIVSGLTSGWGEQARGWHRFMAFDKRTGDTIWVSAPGEPPYDTTYSPPVVVRIEGTRLLIAGGGDGAVHALEPQTGRPVWRYEFSKRGINSGVVVHGTTAIVSHSEENLDTSEMGLIAAIDASARGEIPYDRTSWSVLGFLGGYSSPVTDGERVYQIDNSANLVAFDIDDGQRLWTLNLGTIQRASPVLADGKLYVGSNNGKFYILRPGATECEILDEDQLGTESHPEPIIASAAISGGRVYVVSEEALYCIGDRASGTSPSDSARTSSESSASSSETGAPAHLQVFPTEVVLAPGDSLQFSARLFDPQGRLIGDAANAVWSVEGIPGSVEGTGEISVPAGDGAHAGKVRAKVGDLTGEARVRVIPPLPWQEDFESLPGGAVPRHWIGATGKFEIRELEGNHVLVKKSDNPFLKRGRVFMGPSDWSDYTVEVDVQAIEERRQMGDAGVVAQRHALVLFGNHQRLELLTWQPETERTVRKDFAWKPDTWYRLKLDVANLPDGSVRARGKAWPKSEPEPEAWDLERVDPVPHREGSPGIYADAPYDVFFDNLTVRANP